MEQSIGTAQTREHAVTETSSQDEVPDVRLGRRPPDTADIHLEGDRAVGLLRDLVLSLANVSSEKEAVLRMIGIMHSAIGHPVLIDLDDAEPRVVQDLWK